MDIVYLNEEIINLNELDYYLDECGYRLEFIGVVNNRWIYELVK